MLRCDRTSCSTNGNIFELILSFTENKVYSNLKKNAFFRQSYVSSLYIRENALVSNVESTEFSSLQKEVVAGLSDKDLRNSMSPDMKKLSPFEALQVMQTIEFTDKQIEDIKQSARTSFSADKVDQLDNILQKLKKGSSFDVKMIGWVTKFKNKYFFYVW